MNRAPSSAATRGTIVTVKPPADSNRRLHRCVLLTDPASSERFGPPPTVVVVPLTQKQGLDPSVYPRVEGSPGRSLTGAWQVRPDRLYAIPITMIENVAMERISQGELSAVDDAVRVITGCCSK